MKITETNVAKKLTLEEIEALPKATVIWYAYVNTSDDGVMWHDADPVLICEPGEGGIIYGGDKDSFIDIDISAHMFDDPDVSFWDSEPNRTQLPGITRNEYNALPDPNDDLFTFTSLVTAITSRGMTFEALSDVTGINVNRIYEVLSDQDEIVQWEMVAIRKALKLTDEETKKIFFPESIVPAVLDKI